VRGDPEEIEAAVRRAVANGVLERAARLAAHGADTSPVLREWLTHTLRSSSPLVTVRESAEAVGRTPPTIRRLWRSEVGRSPALASEERHEVTSEFERYVRGILTSRPG